MKVRLAILLLAISLAAPALAEDKVLVIGGQSSLVTTTTELGLTAATNATLTNDSIATSNTAKLVAWCNAVHDSGNKGTLVVPIGKWYVINDTIARTGTNMGIPCGAKIICAGAPAYGRYPVFKTPHNLNTGGFVWIGPTNKPMFRITEHGNTIWVNAYAYPYTTGTDKFPTTDTPSVDRCQTAVEFHDLSGVPVNTQHVVGGSYVGFHRAFFCTNSDHCDHLEFPNVVTRDTDTVMETDNLQSVNHTFGQVSFYNPDRQSVMLNYKRGGTVSGEFMITGNYGFTVLAYGSATGDSQTGRNGAEFDLRVSIDKGNLESINRPQQDHGYCCLIQQHNIGRNTSVRVKMHGRISHAGPRYKDSEENADEEVEWIYSGGNGLVNVVPIVASGHSRSIDLSELWGCPWPTKRKYSPGTLDTLTSNGTYNVTTSAADADLGTVDTLTLPTQDWYRLGGTVKVHLDGATLSSAKTLTLKLRRTNNTATDLDGTTVATVLGTVTSVTGQVAEVSIPEVEYRAHIDGETIALRAQLTNGGAPEAGNIQIVAGTQLRATRLKRQ